MSKKAPSGKNDEKRRGTASGQGDDLTTVPLMVSKKAGKTSIVTRRVPGAKKSGKKRDLNL